MAEALVEMLTVNPHEAETNFSGLLARVEAGEEVVIARNGRRVARLVRARAPRNRGKRLFGSMKGRVSLDNAFFEPLPEEELRSWEAQP